MLRHDTVIEHQPSYQLSIAVLSNSSRLNADKPHKLSLCAVLYGGLDSGYCYSQAINVSIVLI